MKIENSRVRLYALKLSELEEFYKEKFDIANIDFSDFKLSSIQKGAIKIKIGKMNNCESNLHSWYTYWLIVDIEQSKAMGTIGFKGLNADYSAEIGYEISRLFEGRGYMSCTVNLLINWVQSQEICKKITATRVLKNNYGSQRILEKNGFEKVESDGKTFNYELNLLNNENMIVENNFKNFDEYIFSRRIHK